MVGEQHREVTAMNIIEEFFIKLGFIGGNDVKKGIDEASKSLDNFEKKQKQTYQTTKELGVSFNDLVAAGVAAFGTIFTLSSIKQGIQNATEYGASIDRISKLTGESAEELENWDAALKTVGGTQGEFANGFEKLAQSLASKGLIQNISQVLPWLKQFSIYLKQQKELFGPAGAIAAGAKFGIDPNWVLLLENGPESLDRVLADQKAIYKLTQGQADEMRKIQTTWSNIDFLGQRAYTQNTGLLKLWQGIVKELYLAAIGFGELSDKITSSIRSTSLGRWFLGGDASESPVSAEQAPARTVGGNLPKGIRFNNPGNIQPGGIEAQYSSLQQGVDAEESLLQKYGAQGINTLAAIGKKWSGGAAGYSEALASFTGFGINQALNLNDPAVLAAVANAINRQENGSSQWANLVSSAQRNVAYADGSPLNGATTISQSSNVTIQNLTVNTQATDANGIASGINNALQTQLAPIYANYGGTQNY